jgi:hypothetical protein
LAKPRETFIERTENKNLNVHAQLDRLEVLTDKQIDELLVIVEDKRKALLEGDGQAKSPCSAAYHDEL